MLVPPSVLQACCDVRPNGILHVGAHHAEELRAYQKLWPHTKRAWMEADPGIVQVTRQIFGRAADRGLTQGAQDVLVSGAAWTIDGQTVDLHVATNGQSSSLLSPKAHLTEYRDIAFDHTLSVSTVCLDRECSKMGFEPDFINLDIQGAELGALQGAEEILQGVNHTYCEVSKVALYEGAPLVAGIDALLALLAWRGP